MPTTYYSTTNIPLLRLPQIIGQDEVTEAEAAANRERGKGPRRPRPRIPPLIPVSASTWWTGVKSGRFPQPIRLHGNITAWRSEDIMKLVNEGVEP